MDEPADKSELPTEAEIVEAENVPLLFNIPVGLAGRFAHHLLVQSTGTEVTLSFFEVIPPVLSGTPEEQKETLKQGVRADCVSRIIVTRPRYVEFLKAMAGQLGPEEKNEICK